MQLTAVENVKVGSTIAVGGETYTVKDNWTSDLVLHNRFGKERFLRDLIKSLGKEFLFNKHLVGVTNEPPVVQAAPKVDLAADFRQQITANKLKEQVAQVAAASPSNSAKLTDSLKAQVAAKNLTESLKSQVASSKPVETSARIVGGSIDAAKIASPAIAASGTTDLKIGAVNAKVDTVRGQVAQVAVRANEANVKADAANVVATELGHVLNGFAYEQNIRVGSLEETMEEVVEAVNENADELDEVVETVEDFGARLAALEEAEAKRGLQARLNEKLAQNKPAQSAQGGNSMKNVLASFKNLFGKVEGQFALSMFGGVAVRKSAFSQEWVTYDATNGITDVQGNVLKFDVPAFRLPVEPKAVKVGNIVVAANGNYGYVTEVADGYLKVIFPATASQGTVMPVRNPLLGKAFYTVVNVLDIAGGQTGGFNPTLLLALSGEGSKNDLLPLLLASGGLTGAANAGQFDPMMLLAMGGEGGLDDILPLLLLQQGGFAKEGVNPLLFLALGDKGGKGKDLLPLLLAGGGLGGAQGAAGLQGILPFLLMGDDKGGDFKDILMLQALGGGAGLFGAPAAPAPAANEVKDAE